MTVEELGSRMSASEWQEWRAYERVTGPIGEKRFDALAAVISYFSVRPHLDPESDLTPDDFLVDFDTTREAMNRPDPRKEVTNFDG